MVSNNVTCAAPGRGVLTRHGKAASLPVLLAVILLALSPGNGAAQGNAPDARPAVAPMSIPDEDRGTVRQEAANERIAAFLLSEAREELELGELKSARRRLEVLVTRYASSSVAARARRLLEQLALIDGLPMPPIPKDATVTGAVRPPGAGPLNTRTPGTNLLEADFSAAGGDRLFFPDRSDEMGTRGRRVLQEKAMWLQRHPQVFVRIEGHADDTGGDDVNGDIALRRAETVRDLLVEVGVSPTRLHIAAFGRESRVAMCDGPACMAQNRRAVLVLTDARGTRLSSAHDASDDSRTEPRSGGAPALRRDR